VFGGGGSRQLTLDLFFDVTEPVGGVMVKDVREKTDAIVALTRIEPKQGRPPVCQVSWGSAPTHSDFPFTGVITSLSQRFTLFRSTGEPVRADLGLTLLEFLDPEKDQRITDPELTTHLVRRGDTLPNIAAEVYGDPMLWRVIAEANDIDNPRALIVGVTLTIPKMS
jgi:nucleoid-associated protein YgaU